MSKTIEPSWLPRITTPVAKDQADVLRGIRGDYNGGQFGGYAGSMYAVYREVKTLYSGAGGTLSLLTTVVPSGYIYVIQSCLGYHNDTTPRLTTLSVISGEAEYALEVRNALGGNDVLRNIGEFVLQAGEQLRLLVVSIAAERNMYLDAIGYSVRLQ